MKFFYYLFFQFIFVLSSFAQDVELLDKSAFKHDYFVTGLQYLEDVKDTANTQFVASIKISGNHQNLIITSWYNVLKMKAKELGANLYYIESYTEKEDNAVIYVKMFFAGVNFVKKNKTKGNKNSIYIFNQGRSKNDTACFYLNQKKIEFDQKKYYQIVTKPYQIYNIGMSAKKSKKQNHSFPKDAPSVFYILPGNKNLMINSVTNTQNGMNISIGKNKPIECDYNLGRFLIEIYKDPGSPDRVILKN